MGLFDNSQFMAPSGLEPSTGPSLGDFLSYKDKQKRQDIDYQKELMDFQSHLRLNELAKSMLAEKANQPPKPPMNVVYKDQDYIDPYHRGQLELGRDKLSADVSNKQGQLELGKEKLDVTKENYETKNQISQQNADSRKHLALLHNLTTSEQIRLLQEGKVSLQEIRDADAMERVEKQGEIKSGQIDQQGNIRSGQIAQQGEISLAGIAARGAEARTTKGTPSADAGVTAHLPTQQKVAQQLRMNEGILQNPAWESWMSIDPNTGLVKIQPPGGWGGPTQKEYDAMSTHMKGTQPAPNPPNVVPPNTNVQPNKNTTPKVSPNVQPQSSDTIEMLTPDGKSTRTVPKNQVEQAKAQGYTIKG